MHDVAGMRRSTKRSPAKSAAKQRAQRWGARAEAWCAWWLRCQGYRILAQRHRNRHGEIDIIAQRRAVVAMIEVKARDNRAAALEAVSPRQRSRIERAAAGFLSTRPDLAEHTVRFDVIAVVPWRWPHHIVDAWRP